MANSKITFNNTTVTGVNNSLIVGELRISTPMPGAIDIPQQAEAVDSNVIFQRGDDITFKSLMHSSPVRSFGIKLYDQCGHLCNKWEPNRYDNSSGNVRITSENKFLFSNIEMAKGLTGQTYLVITSYGGFERCVMKSFKKYLAEKDFETLSTMGIMSDVILFISEQINTELNEFGIDLTKIFKAVHTSPTTLLVAHFAEFIAGKSVAGSRPSFQGMLNFGPGVEVAVARFRSVKDTPTIECQIRRGGRIQINSENKNSAVKFFIILKHTSPDTIKVTEEFTESEFSIVPYSAGNLPGLEAEHFTTLFDGFNFLEKINSNKAIEAVSKFINENQSSVVAYMFASPLTVFELVDSDSESSQMIIEYGSTLRQQIYQILVTHASKTFTGVHKKPRKNVMFGDNEMHPNYSEPVQLYSAGVNFHGGAGRLSSVPNSGPYDNTNLVPALSCSANYVHDDE